jgi:hypothetical protein
MFMGNFVETGWKLKKLKHVGALAYIFVRRDIALFAHFILWRTILYAFVTQWIVLNRKPLIKTIFINWHLPFISLENIMKIYQPWKYIKTLKQCKLKKWHLDFEIGLVYCRSDKKLLSVYRSRIPLPPSPHCSSDQFCN